uniref:Uncharacterized protein n=1 Tax=Rhizophora mucronata TaxID=61149 RepID=A0A2P2II29_RHIMU
MNRYLAYWQLVDENRTLMCSFKNSLKKLLTLGHGLSFKPHGLHN